MKRAVHLKKKLYKLQCIASYDVIYHVETREGKQQNMIQNH